MEMPDSAADAIWMRMHVYKTCSEYHIQRNTNVPVLRIQASSNQYISTMRNISMWVTIYDPFTRHLGIDDNWNRLDYPWIFIIPVPFFLFVESLLCKLKSSVFSYTDCIHIVIQQTRTAESEVLHPTLPNWPLTLLQNPKPTEYHEIGCPSNRYTAFRDSSLSTIYNKLSLNPCNCNCCHSCRSYVLKDLSKHLQFCATRSPLKCWN